MKLSLLLGLWLLGMIAPAQAQVDPSLDPLPIPAPLPESSPLPLDGSTPPATLPPPADTTTIVVTRIIIQGSTLFSASELAALITPYENRTTTLAELQTLARQINQRYLDAGYITTQVRIPEQTVADGLVTVEVLEGQLVDITVEGDTRYQDYITRRLNLASREPLNQPQLEDQLQLLQLSGLFSTVEARLQPGELPGTSRLGVTVTEADPLQGRGFFDNYSPTAVGEVRTGGALSYRSLFALGDTLSVGVSATTTGGAQAYTVGYQLPLTPQETTLRLGFSYETFRVTDRSNPVFDLGIRGDSRIYEAEVRHPLIRTPREEFALSFSFRHRDGRSVLLDTLTLPNRTSVFQFSQDYLRRDGSGAWAARSQFNLGTGLLDATTNPSPQADSRFLSWLGQGQRVQQWNPNNVLIARADVQLSGDSLLGSEQFVIGGGQSIRGYRQNVRGGDSGFRFSAENRTVLGRRPDNTPLVQLVPFTDLGAVWFSNPATQPTQQNFLWGAGLGVIFTPIARLEARLDAGFPLVDLTEVTDRSNGAQFHFSLGYSW